MSYKIPHKMHPLKEKPYKSKKYLHWLHTQGLNCLVCGSPQIEIHHLDHGNRGRADNRTVPLCPEHHRGRNSPHGAEKRAFEYMHMVAMEEYAEELFNTFKAEASM